MYITDTFCMKELNNDLLKINFNCAIRLVFLVLKIDFTVSEGYITAKIIKMHKQGKQHY